MSRRLGGAWLVGGILLLAGLARFLSFRDYEFDFDNAYSAYLALRFLDGGAFPLQSLYSTFLFANPPWMSYLQMPFLAVWRSPYAVVIPILLLNSLGTVFVYRLTLEVAGRRGAAAAALLFALAPWVVHFSRRTWHPGLYPLLAPAMSYFLIRMLRTTGEPARRNLLAGMACFGLLSQTSLIGYLALPQVAATLWLARRRIRARWVAAGVGLILVTSSPYLAGLALDRAGALGRLREFSAAPATVDLEAARHAVRLVTGHMYAQVFFDDGGPASTSLAALSEAMHWLLLVILAAGMGLSARDVLRGRDADGVHRALLLWLVLPVVLMTVHRNLIYPRYLLISLPAGFVLVGRAWATARWRGVGVGLAVVAAVMAANLAQHHRFLQSHTGFDLDHLSLRNGRALGSRVDELARAAGATEVHVRMHQATLTALAGRRLVTYEDFDGRSAWVLRPDRPAVYVVQGEAPSILPEELRRAGRSGSPTRSRCISMFRGEA